MEDLSIREYLARADRLMVRANWATLSEKSKISTVKRGLTRFYKEKMASTKVYEKYEEYRRDLLVLDSSLGYSSCEDEPAQTSKAPSRKGKSYTPTRNENSSGGRRRARWVSAAEQERRRKEGRCFRCGMSSHSIRNCPHAGPIPPGNTPNKVRATRDVPDLESSDSEEGNSEN
ncbi:hypothetical protein Cpir12675_006996 [Ceratocystis pirilliformis]|uniref:CCHC-type domain-containing protein n=1 Tax=Ceratocystis pirilliformis TaxID=259994 RepID=A0ABR3YAK5_9PEZI